MTDERRLITVDTGTVEISQEALLTAWPQLRSWLDAARAWRHTDRDDEMLYREHACRCP